MNDELDPNLLALFEAAKKEPLDEHFVRNLMAKIDGERRQHLVIWMVVAALVAAVAYLLAGPVAATVELVGHLLPTSLIEFETDWMRQIMSPLNSVAAALAIGILLVRRFWHGIFG